jgi:hypothetical protein
MNEPHEVDITKWGATLQMAVNAIRKAGATTQTIIVPGNDWTHIPDYYNGLNNPVVVSSSPSSFPSPYPSRSSSLPTSPSSPPFPSRARSRSFPFAIQQLTIL